MPRNWSILHRMKSTRRMSARRSIRSQHPAIEVLESRALLAAPTLLTPAHSSLVSDTTPEFSWSEVEGAVRYDLWVNNRTTGQSGIIRDATIPQNSYTPETPLTAGHDYIWTVRGFDAEDNPSEWAAHSVFKIENALARPVLTAPASTTNDTTPTFEWTAIAGADRYDIWVNNRTTGQSGIIRNNNVTQNSFTPTTPLTVGHNYIWTVQAISDSGPTSEWAAHSVFTVSNTLDTPMPTAPGANTDDTTPTFEWTAVDGAVRYDLWVNDRNTGQSGIIRDATIPQNSYTPETPLTAGHNYIWTVRAFDAEDNPSEWAPHAVFRISNALAQPVLTAPASTTNDTTPTFEWTAIAGADRYDIWVNNRTTGQSGIIRNNNVTQNSFTPTTPLTVGHNYIWTVQAISDSGLTSEWAAHSVFTVSNTLDTPMPTAPGANTDDTTPTFEWTAVDGAVRYDLWVNNRTTGQSGIIRDATIPQNSYTPETPLTAGHNYIWTVRAFDAEDNPSEWAPHAVFEISNALARPVLTAPGATTSDTTPTFEWTAIAGATRYDIWVNNRTTGQSGIIRNNNVTQNSFTPTTPLPDGHNYIWTVQAISDSGQTSEWAAHRTFVIDASSDPGTFQSTDVPKAIPDNGTTTSALTVSGLSGSIADVDVTLNITHRFAADLDVFLISPNGTRVELFTDVGGSGNHFTDTTLDDSAATAITAGSAPFSGRFRPESPLSAFNGLNPTGVWTLELTDDVVLEAGTLNSWSLKIETGNDLVAPSPFTAESQSPTFEWAGAASTQQYEMAAGTNSNDPVRRLLSGSVQDTGSDDDFDERTSESVVVLEDDSSEAPSSENSSSGLLSQSSDEIALIDELFADWRGPIV